MIYVRLYQRKNRSGNYSIEGVFDNLQKILEQQVQFLTNDEQQHFIQSRETRIINHITGDIHFKALKLPKKYTVLTVHDIGHYEKTLKGYKKWIYKWVWLKLPFLKVRYITCVSEYTRQRILHHFKISPDKIKVIYNPVPVGFTFSEWPNNAVPVLLQIGTRPHKNLETVIKSIEGMQVKLFIVGTLSEDQRLALDESKTDFTNFTNLTNDKIVALYQQADLVTFVSTHEGFGLPVIEAQACGRPVIISGCASLPEIAGQGACMIHDPLNVQLLRDKIQEILQNKSYRDQIIKDGLQNIKRFSPEVIAGEYLSIYNAMLNGSNVKSN